MHIGRYELSISLLRLHTAALNKHGAVVVAVGVGDLHGHGVAALVEEALEGELEEGVLRVAVLQGAVAFRVHRVEFLFIHLVEVGGVGRVADFGDKGRLDLAQTLKLKRREERVALDLLGALPAQSMLLVDEKGVDQLLCRHAEGRLPGHTQHLIPVHHLKL